jgi:hypothetical protein
MNNTYIYIYIYLWLVGFLGSLGFDLDCCQYQMLTSSAMKNHVRNSS